MDYESPLLTILQQQDARPVTGEHLEVLGKQAASGWVQGKFASLHEAVVSTVRAEHLAPEQVCRVVEFANQDAYLQEFRKEGGSHKVVHFDCGPASPAQVLQDLNDGGGGSLWDDGMSDYRMPPKHAAKEPPAAEGLTRLPNLPALPKGQKVASSEDCLWEAFACTGAVDRPAEPLQPLVEVRQKLAGAADHLASELSEAELEYSAACTNLLSAVKQASLGGTSLGDVVRAWAVVSEDTEYVKQAFAYLAPAMLAGGVFTQASLEESISKCASAGTANPGHPVVTAYKDFVSTLGKLAALREVHTEVLAGAACAEDLLKKASLGQVLRDVVGMAPSAAPAVQRAAVAQSKGPMSKGLVGLLSSGVSGASKAIDTAAPAVAKVLVGPEGAAKLAPALASGGKIVGGAGALLAGNAALQNITDRPSVSSALSTINSVIPGTAEYQNRRYLTMTGQR